MPNYDFQCDDCATVWEEHRRIKDKAPPCPVCEGKNVEKLMPTRISVVTDSTYSRGRGTLLDQFNGDEKETARMVAKFKAQGVNPSNHDFYEPCLAEFPGDARALIPQDSPRTAMAQRIAERGVNIVDGRAGVATKHVKAKEEDRSKKRLAPFLVEEKRYNMLKRNPSLAKRNQNELRKEIVQKHAHSLGEGKTKME